MGTAEASAGSTASEGPIRGHLLPESATEAPDGGLVVGGVSIRSLVDRFGTPLFVYDEAQLRSRCREAFRAFGEGVAYATKAFLCTAIAKIAIEEGLCLDVSTAGELAVAVAAGAKPSQIVMHGNNKSSEEVDAAIALGVRRIIVDSFDEIGRIADALSRIELEHPQQVLIRVNPGVEAHTHEYVTTGQEDSKFGFSLANDAAERALRQLNALPGVEVVGAHAHIGSQIFELDSFRRELEALVPFVVENGLDEMCVGGGIGVAYLNSESAPSITQWAQYIRSTLIDLGVPDHIKITAEPGRAIVAVAGLTCYTVGTVKVLPGIRTYLAVDGGMSDNPRPVLYGSGYEVFLARRLRAPRTRAVRLVGKHCESGDVVVADARLPEDVAVGDVVITPVTGAYGYAMASNYNRLPRPGVVFVSDGSARVVIRRESIDDLLRLES